MLQDGLGSVRAEIAQNVAVNGSQSYAPYGEVFGASGTMSSPFAFTGEPLDGNGLQYHRARYYDPAMGSWIKQDLIETQNRYAYADGNPVNLTDSSGLQACTLGYVPNPDYASDPNNQPQCILDVELQEMSATPPSDVPDGWGALTSSKGSIRVIRCNIICIL